MKKIYNLLVFILILSLSIILFSCSKATYRDDITIIAPSGTPTLGISNYLVTTNEENYNIVDGADPLRSAFINKTHDIIIAPTNLGAMLYNKGLSNYSLYKTIVWGNVYIVSNIELTSITELNNKRIFAFGETSTPGIILKYLINYYNLNVDITWGADVATANPQYLKGNFDIILSAEPSISNLKTKKSLYTLDLQAEYQKISGSFSYPQASIFVLKESLNKYNIKHVLHELEQSIINTTNSSLTASNAVEVSETFNTLGVDVISTCIPNCHFGLINNEQEAVEFYFNQLAIMNLTNMYGGKLPDEEFYI